MKVELAIISPDSTPTFRCRRNTAQSAFKFVRKGNAKSRLLLVIPERGRFQFGVRFRMTDDAHEASGECSEWSFSPVGN